MGNYIKHVVIIVQENRSFDNLFAAFPGADGQTYGKNSMGQQVALKQIGLLSKLNLDNSHAAYDVDYDNGKMDGWNLVYVNDQPCATCAYAYVNPKKIVPYWTLAQQYALADHMFATESSGSFNAHQDLIRGDATLNSTQTLIDFPSHGPWGCDAQQGTTVPLLTSQGKYVMNGPFPCLAYETLRDLLDAKSVSWKYYAPPLFTGGLAGAYWDGFDAIQAVRDGPEWQTNISSPEKNVFKDISHGTLADVSWVIPDGANSD
ncbi:MAG TPA: alkaline phosphatase family protein, partial [Candidatus Tumulicola sp.]|nr:alkaline phosphatase family protein [Candidatus Tumulicola sp.]